MVHFLIGIAKCLYFDVLLIIILLIGLTAMTADVGTVAFSAILEPHLINGHKNYSSICL